MENQEAPHVTKDDIKRGLRSLNITAGVEVHSSLSSFGYVEGGAETVVDALLETFPLVMVPTFTDQTWTFAPDGVHYERNGDMVEWNKLVASRPAKPWHPDMPAHKRIGAIPEAFRKRPGVIRSTHPTHALAAKGPGAAEILATQTLENPMGAIETFLKQGGWILMLGARIGACTAYHAAEHLAGFPYFRRWAIDSDGLTCELPVPMCAGGIKNLVPLLAGVARETKIGNSKVLAWPGPEFLEISVGALRRDPSIAICPSACVYCRNRNAGGPVRV